MTLNSSVLKPHEFAGFKIDKALDQIYNLCMNTKTLNISMPAELVKKIDRQSKLQGSNRSDFIRRAVYRQLGALEQWQAVTQAMRANYKGPKLSEKEVANVVRKYRDKQAAK